MQAAPSLYTTYSTKIPLDFIPFDNPRKDAAVLHHCHAMAGGLRLVLSALAGTRWSPRCAVLLLSLLLLWLLFCDLYIVCIFLYCRPKQPQPRVPSPAFGP